MSNFLKNIDLLEDNDGWKKPKTAASVKTVLKPRNPEDESADFFKAQSDMSKDGLPAQSIADDHKGGYRGDEGVPQGKIGSIQLEEKGSTQIGDHYLPDGAWNGKDKVKPPITQQSSSSEYCIAENPITIDVGSLIEQALKKDIEDVSIKVKF